MAHVIPAVSLDEVFSVNKRIRWAALTSDRGEVIYCQQRPAVESYSPTPFDQEFVQLGPLTLLGTAEKYSEYLKGVDHVVVWFGAVIAVFSRIETQVLSVTIEKDLDVLSQFLDWLTDMKTRIRQ